MVPVSPIVTKADNCNSRCQNEADGDENQIDVGLVTSWRRSEQYEEQEAQNRPRDWRHLMLSRQDRAPIPWLNQSLFQDVMPTVRALCRTPECNPSRWDWSG